MCDHNSAAALFEVVEQLKSLLPRRRHGCVDGKDFFGLVHCFSVALVVR